MDRRLRPVLDLARDDFELLVDGLPHAIATFDPPLAPPETAERFRRRWRKSRVPAAPAPAGPGKGTPPDRPGPEAGEPAVPGDAGETPDQPAGRPAAGPPPSHVALVLDLYQTRLTRMGAAIEATRTFLEEGLPQATSAGLFAITRGELRTLIPFTTDAARLETGLEEISHRTELMDTWVMHERERYREIEEAIYRPPVVAGYSAEQSLRVRHVLEALEALSAAMAHLPGRKNVVLLTDGIRSQAGLNYAMGSLDLARETVDLDAEFRATTRVFKKAGVALSPISLQGMPINSFSDELFDSLWYLANETGGRTPRTLNDFVRELEAASAQPRWIYLIGFHPAAAGQPGTAHSIQVRVRRQVQEGRAHLDLSYRTEYVDGERGFDDRTLLAGAALLPDQFRELPLEASVHYMPAPGGETELQVQMVLPAVALAWIAAEGGRRQGAIEVHGLLRDTSGRRRELFRSRYALRVDPVHPPRRLVMQETATVSLEQPAELVLLALDGTSRKPGAASFSLPARPVEKTGTRVGAPILLVPGGDHRLLTPTGKLLFGLADGRRIFLSEDHPAPASWPILVMTRVNGLPADGRVRFCLEAGSAACVEAQLRSEAAGPPATWTAWAALGREAARATVGIQAEALDGGGNVLAAASRTAPPHVMIQDARGR